MTQGTYTLPSVARGDTWVGVPLMRVEINGDPPASALARVRLQARKKPDATGAALIDLDSEDDTITVDDAAAWEFSIPAQVVDVAAGTYHYDIETTDAADAVKKYIKGTWTILPRVTR